MLSSDYQTAVKRTMSMDQATNEALANFALGLCGEAGESADIIKKVVFHGHPFDLAARDKLIKELGDVAWYIAATATVIGADLGDILEKNVKKLEARYPNGFTQDDSINRKD